MENEFIKKFSFKNLNINDNLAKTTVRLSDEVVIISRIGFVDFEMEDTIRKVGNKYLYLTEMGFKKETLFQIVNHIKEIE
jgi:flagellar basal body rod protein FlgG